MSVETAHDGAISDAQAQQQRDQRAGGGKIKTALISDNRRKMLKQQIEQQAEQRDAQAKTELAIDIPQCAGVRQLLIGDVQERAALRGAAAQAAAKAHQGKGANLPSMISGVSNLRQRQNTQSLQQAAGNK
ncbi:hypothetical protein D3C79_852950 [compost metagenome]